MSRKGQKSLNMWIPNQIHLEIKREAMRNDVSIKDYIVNLHLSQIRGSGQIKEFRVSENQDPQYHPVSELQQISVQVAELIEKYEMLHLTIQTSQLNVEKEKQTTERDLSSITSAVSKKEATKVNPIKVINELQSEILPVKEGHFPSIGDISKQLTIDENKSISLPVIMEQYLTEIKRNNPRTRIANYKETLAAIMNGNHSRKSIEEYRGFIFYGSKSKNSEKPLKNLESLGLIEVRFENESKPNQKSYFISQNFLSV